MRLGSAPYAAPPTRRLGGYSLLPGRRSVAAGAIRILERIFQRLQKKATQNPSAITAVAMNPLGETSHDVSATMRPNAMHVNIIANMSRIG